MNYLNGLNERQKEAVLHKDGPLLIVAGAGAGKTKTIAHRIAHLIASGVSPRNILAVTFTNKAAREMGDRVANILASGEAKTDFGANSPSGRELTKSVLASPLISTFHSLGVMILKDNAAALGISRYFSILDKDESLSLIKKSIKELGLNPKEINPNAAQATISREKNRLVTPEIFLAKTEGGHWSSIVHPIWRRYEEKLREQKAFDFDDLILRPVMLLRANEKIRNYYQDLWQYIHIDEYQDTNTAQYELGRILAEKHGNICVVGDSDQAIYGWRQADFRNILNFEKNFPGTKTVLLEENYRSTQTILDVANRIIKKNKQRKEKNLFTGRGRGEKISVYTAMDEGDEADWVVENIQKLIESARFNLSINKGGMTAAEEIAVLYRANFQSRILEEKFLRGDVAYQILGTRFYERKEVKDLVAFLRYALNPDDKESMERIINVPPRGIGDVSFKKIISGEERKLPERLRQKLREFRATMTRFREVILKEKLSTAIKFIVKNSEMEKELKEAGDDGEERIENLKELVTICSKYDFLPPEEAADKFLTETALLSDQDSLTEKKNGVKLMTVHASKGLEFKSVFVVGLEEELFPHRKLNPDEESDPEEERRLFYVALTRAKDKLFLSYANMRTIFGQRKINLPSEFLGDIDEGLVASENIPEEIIEWNCLK